MDLVLFLDALIMSFLMIKLNQVLLQLQCRSIHTTLPSAIKLTQVVSGEPPKARKRIDPALLKAREDRKRRKIEKEIKKLEKFGRQLKPINELRADKDLLKEVNVRKRKNLTKKSEDEVYNEGSLVLEWSRYKITQNSEQMKQINTAIQMQSKALKELKKDNLSLYEMAIELDENNLVNFKHDGPSYTPPNKLYEPPEGDYADATFMYDRR